MKLWPLKKKEEKESDIKPHKPFFPSIMLFKKKPEIAVKEQTLFKIQIQQKIIELPEIHTKTTFDIRYPLIEPYAYARIHYDPSQKDLIYEVEEPQLDEHEQKVLHLLEEGIRELINLSILNIKDPHVIIEYLEKNMKLLLYEFKIKITKESFLKMMYYIYRDFVGLNEIEPFMNDYFIEDIECNGVNTPIYIVHRKYRNIRTNIVYPDIKRLTGFVEKLAQKAGKYISYATPLLDGRLPDGSRLNATYTQEIASRGPAFTIRKFAKEPWTPVKLMEFRTVPPEILAYLWLLIEYESNLIVIGGTGSGKTSFLNSVAFFIPPAARVVSIEDTKELQLMHENWLPSIARAGVGLANIMGQRHGEVSLFDLLKESFRQRPDYVIVGEIRGQEAFVLFQGAASGHPTMSTMHAEDVETMVRRLETRPISLSPALIASLDAVCIMVQAKVKGKTVRRLKEVVEVVEVKEGGKAMTNVPFSWDPATDTFYFKRDSRVFDRISRRHGISKAALYNEFRLRTELLMALYRQKVFSLKEVQDAINAYYKTPDAVLRRFKIKP